MGKLFNQKVQNTKRRILRNESTKAEKLLWAYVKVKQIKGYKFRRQFSVGSYVLDFYCPSLRFAIEVDGSYHNAIGQIEKDKERQSVIEECKINFIRFKNEDIFQNIDDVNLRINEKMMELSKKSRPPLNPLLSKEGT